jgi:hypothetical protein
MMNLDTAFLPNQETVFEKDFLSYGYSLSARQWGLLRVDGKDPLLYICEIPVNQVFIQKIISKFSCINKYPSC